MFYPYFRGRQYELIALRDLAEKNLIKKDILPIIEPIKLSPTLFSFMEIFSNQPRQFGLVQNPVYGSFLENLQRDTLYHAKYLSFFGQNNNCLPVYIFNNKISAVHRLDVSQNAIAICNDKDIISNVNNFSNSFNVDKIIIPDERIFKRSIRGKRILQADNFNKLQRNVDYADTPDEFYSDDHLYFLEEGFIGFSDFSIIGDGYTEAGFAPYAVVIHMVYFDNDKTLRIHHFVSDSNEGIEDPAGKFAEALSKLIDAAFFYENETYAYNQFKYLYENRIYPGLGVVKKLSIMHHMELISRYLDEKI